MRLIQAFVIFLFVLTNCTQKSYDIKELKILSYKYVFKDNNYGKNPMTISPYLYATLNDSGICRLIKKDNLGLICKEISLDSGLINGLLLNLNRIKSDSDLTTKDEILLYHGPEISLFYKDKFENQRRIVFVDSYRQTFFKKFYRILDSTIINDNKSKICDTLAFNGQIHAMVMRVDSFTSELFAKFDSTISETRVGLRLIERLNR
jgi:hypothetical protein